MLHEVCLHGPAHEVERCMWHQQDVMNLYNCVCGQASFLGRNVTTAEMDLASCKYSAICS